jgi:threonine dehydrogenase-like Zn-dependent dehydrogenase
MSVGLLGCWVVLVVGSAWGRLLPKAASGSTVTAQLPSQGVRVFCVLVLRRLVLPTRCPAGKPQFVNELVRVCAPGGRIIIVTWCHRVLQEGEQGLRPDEKVTARSSPL